MEIRKIFVAGTGLIGGGIAQVCAQAGYKVIMRDLTDEIVEMRSFTRSCYFKGRYKSDT